MSDYVEWVHLGKVWVDSGHLAIIDPCAADCVTSDWEKRRKESRFLPRGSAPVDGHHGPEYGLLLAGFGGDGNFDVYGRYGPPALVPEAKPTLLEVRIDFGGFYKRMLRSMEREGQTPEGWFEGGSTAPESGDAP